LRELIGKIRHSIYEMPKEHKKILNNLFDKYLLENNKISKTLKNDIDKIINNK
jgi:hypothetical protein